MGSPGGWFRSRYLAIVVTGVLGIVASLGAFALVLSWENRVAEIDFQSKAQSYLDAINNDLGDARTLIYTMAEYVDTNEHAVGRHQFDLFAGILHERVVGLRNIGWAPRIRQSERAAFERTQLAVLGIPGHERIFQRSGPSAFIVAKNRASYYPILYAQTVRGYRKTEFKTILGFDLTSEPLRSAAIHRTILTGQPSATTPLKLVAGSSSATAGVMAFMTVGGHRKSSNRPVGVVLSAFEIGPMIENIIGKKMRQSEVDLYVFDFARKPGKRLIYWHTSTPGRLAPAERDIRRMTHWEGTITLIDQRLGAVVVPALSASSWKNGIWTAMLTLSAGLALTGLLVGYLFVSLRRAIRLEDLTVSLQAATEDLHRNTADLERSAEDLHQKSEQMAHMARHDALTGLANRLVFHERISEAMSRRGGGALFAILYLDLDHFKDVNDTLGHSAGDRLLCIVAERITKSLRESDTISRLGGDEFAIILADLADREFVATAAERLIRDVSEPFSIDGVLVTVGVSIGITFGAEDKTVDSLVKEADLALYEAKRVGRATHRFFEPRLSLQMEARLTLKSEMRRGLAGGEFEVYYQPMVNIAQNRVTGFEALVRWNHPDRGLLGPDKFISVAEESGLIVELGAWVLRTACEEAAQWPSAVKVAVNLSPIQFKSETLAADVELCLAASGLPANRLEIEITEAAVLQESRTTLAVLDDLRALGIAVSFDDFGTGFSSLSSLLRFPFDKLKIDRSFVADPSESAAAIVRAIVGMGVNLGLATTGEGVETAEQLDHLRRLGCAEAQGYFFSPPRPNAEVPRLLRELGEPDQNRLFDRMSLTGAATLPLISPA